MEVVKRAEVISTDFARQFKERIEGKRTSTLPMVAQADFAYLVRLVNGTEKLSENKTKRREVLKSLLGSVPNYIQTSV